MNDYRYFGCCQRLLSMYCHNFPDCIILFFLFYTLYYCLSYQLQYIHRIFTVYWYMMSSLHYEKQQNVFNGLKWQKFWTQCTTLINENQSNQIKTKQSIRNGICSKIFRTLVLVVGNHCKYRFDDSRFSEYILNISKA